MSNKNRPTSDSLLDVQEPYARVGLNFGCKMALGALVAVPAMVVFRGRGARTFLTGMGIGTGAGVALQQSRMHFKFGDEIQPLPKSLDGELKCYQRAILENLPWSKKEEAK